MEPFDVGETGERFASKSILAARCLDGVDESLARPTPDGGSCHVQSARHFTGRHPVLLLTTGKTCAPAPHVRHAPASM